MGIKVDLNKASRETLLSVIAEQQGTIIRLQRRIEELERRVSPRGRPVGMPGNKTTPKGRQQGDSDKRGRRKQRAHGFARRRMEPTRRVVHAPESCPECGTGLTGGWVHGTREVIEVPVVSGRGCRACHGGPDVRAMPEATAAQGTRCRAWWWSVSGLGSTW